MRPIEPDDKYVFLVEHVKAILDDNDAEKCLEEVREVLRVQPDAATTERRWRYFVGKHHNGWHDGHPKRRVGDFIDQIYTRGEINRIETQTRTVTEWRDE